MHLGKGNNAVFAQKGVNLGGARPERRAFNNRIEKYGFTEEVDFTCVHKIMNGSLRSERQDRMERLARQPFATCILSWK